MRRLFQAFGSLGDQRGDRIGLFSPAHFSACGTNTHRLDICQRRRTTIATKHRSPTMPETMAPNVHAYRRFESGSFGAPGVTAMRSPTVRANVLAANRSARADHELGMSCTFRAADHLLR